MNICILAPTVVEEMEIVEVLVDMEVEVVVEEVVVVLVVVHFLWWVTLVILLS